YWDANARGALLGLSRGTNKAHIVKATLDAQAYQTRDLLDAMEQDSDVSLKEMRVDGGLVVNDYIVQKIADIADLKISKPVNSEATAWGAAAMAGLGTGVFNELRDVNNLWEEKRSFTPQIDNVDRDFEYNGWLEAVSRVRTTV
ncbi:MAG: glycerol kinase, partial [Phototrophicales bacterium]